MPLLSRDKARYIAEANTKLNRLLATNVEDLELIVAGLNWVLGNTSTEPAEKLKALLNDIKLLTDEPECYVQFACDYAEYIEIINERIKAKIKEIESLNTEEEKQAYFAEQSSTRRELAQNQLDLALKQKYGYFLRELTASTKQLSYEIYINTTEEGVRYEVIGLDGILKKNIIPWNELPPDFPRDVSKIMLAQEKCLQALLNYTIKLEHTRPKQIHPPELGSAARVITEQELLQQMQQQFQQEGVPAQLFVGFAPQAFDEAVIALPPGYRAIYQAAYRSLVGNNQHRLNSQHAMLELAGLTNRFQLEAIAQISSAVGVLPDLADVLRAWPGEFNELHKQVLVVLLKDNQQRWTPATALVEIQGLNDQQLRFLARVTQLQVSGIGNALRDWQGELDESQAQKLLVLVDMPQAEVRDALMSWTGNFTSRHREVLMRLTTPEHALHWLRNSFYRDATQVLIQKRETYASSERALRDLNNIQLQIVARYYEYCEPQTLNLLRQINDERQLAVLWALLNHPDKRWGIKSAIMELRGLNDRALSLIEATPALQVPGIGKVLWEREESFYEKHAVVLSALLSDPGRRWGLEQALTEIRGLSDTQLTLLETVPILRVPGIGGALWQAQTDTFLNSDRTLVLSILLSDPSRRWSAIQAIEEVRLLRDEQLHLLDSINHQQQKKFSWDRWRALDALLNDSSLQWTPAGAIAAIFNLDVRQLTFLREEPLFRKPEVLYSLRREESLIEEHFTLLQFLLKDSKKRWSLETALEEIHNLTSIGFTMLRRFDRLRIPGFGEALRNNNFKWDHLFVLEALISHAKYPAFEMAVEEIRGLDDEQLYILRESSVLCVPGIGNALRNNDFNRNQLVVLKQLLGDRRKRWTLERALEEIHGLIDEHLILLTKACELCAPGIGNFLRSNQFSQWRLVIEKLPQYVDLVKAIFARYEIDSCVRKLIDEKRFSLIGLFTSPSELHVGSSAAFFSGEANVVSRVISQLDRIVNLFKKVDELNWIPDFIDSDEAIVENRAALETFLTLYQENEKIKTLTDNGEISFDYVVYMYSKDGNLDEFIQKAYKKYNQEYLSEASMLKI